MFETGYYLTNTENLKLFLSYGILVEHNFYPKYYTDIQALNKGIPTARTEEEILNQFKAALTDDPNLSICLISKKNDNSSESFLNVPLPLNEIEIHLKSNAEIKDFKNSLNLYGDICIEGISLKAMNAKQRKFFEKIENSTDDILPTEEVPTDSAPTNYITQNIETYDQALRAGSLLSVMYSLSKNNLEFSKFYTSINREEELESMLSFLKLIEHAKECDFKFNAKEELQLNGILLKLFNTIKNAQQPNKDLISNFLQTETNFQKPSWAIKAKEILFKIIDINEGMTKSALINSERSIFQTLCFVLLTKETWEELCNDSVLMKQLDKNDLLLAGIFMGVFRGYNRVGLDIKKIKNVNVYMSAKICALIRPQNFNSLPNSLKPIYDLIIPKSSENKIKFLASNLEKLGFNKSDIDELVNYELPTTNRIIIENGSVKGQGFPKLKLSINDQLFFERMKLTLIPTEVINKL